MRFEWNCLRDFTIGYLKNVLWQAIVLWGVVSAVLYLITAYVFGDYLPTGQWVRIAIAIFIATLILAQGFAYHRIAKRLIPGERI